jgi:arylsulfatase
MEHWSIGKSAIVWFLGLLAITISCSNQSGKKQEDDRPNILLLVADDLGYADLGCYGGDIQTPHIDSLAARGIRFSRFHTSPLCAPTRAMLLSGTDHHIAGMGNMFLRSDDFGYEGILTDRIVPIPALLRKSGYHTYMVGKWHLGTVPSANPARKGFEFSFVNLLGAGNHYNDVGFGPDNPVTPYTEHGKPATWNNGSYSTDFYTDKLISYINTNKEDNKPFFAFAAYTSPHWPLQVDEKYWKKYQGLYDDGYEKLRERRLESLKAAGMIPADAVLPPMHPDIKPWDSMPPDEKKVESRKMELYAGMVDNLDFNIGRLLQHLQDIGEYDNTIIIFMSDNGAAAEDFYHNAYYARFLNEHFSNDYENMGRPNSFVSYGPQWAEAGSSPFRYFKGYTTEGGINAPMIIAGPHIKRKNGISDVFLTLMDIAPTIYEVARIQYPETFDGHTVYPLKGNSLIPFASGKSDEVHAAEYIFGLEHNHHAMLRRGDWKITNFTLPFREDNFALYHLPSDLAEMHDLKASEPEKYQELLVEWRRFSEEVKAKLPNPSAD